MADDGWISPKPRSLSSSKQRIPLSQKTLVPVTVGTSEIGHPDLIYPNGEPISPQNWPRWPTGKPILPPPYENLRSPERYHPFPRAAKPSAAIGSRPAVDRRPLAVMMEQSGGVDGGNRRSAVRGHLLRCSPVGPAGGVEVAGVQEIDGGCMQLPSPPPACPFSCVGDTWDECVAEVDREMNEMEAEMRAGNR